MMQEMRYLTHDQRVDNHKCVADVHLQQVQHPGHHRLSHADRTVTHLVRKSRQPGGAAQVPGYPPRLERPNSSPDEFGHFSEMY